eukprot:2574742-Amphidinium_carterae.4
MSYACVGAQTEREEQAVYHWPFSTSCMRLSSTMVVWSPALPNAKKEVKTLIEPNLINAVTCPPLEFRRRSECSDSNL